MRVARNIKFPTRPAVVAHCAMNGVVSIALQIVSFGRGRLHEHKQVPCPMMGVIGWTRGEPSWRRERPAWSCPVRRNRIPR